MEQLHRVQRYIDRIREIYAGRPHMFKRVEYYEDDVVSFFIHCHHLADWLSQTYPTKYQWQALQTFINKHVELRICADLCNGKKHCRINRLRSGFQPDIANRHWLIATYKPEMNKPITFFCQYEIDHNGVRYDALKLAEACLGLWRAEIRRAALSAI